MTHRITPAVGRVAACRSVHDSNAATSNVSETQAQRLRLPLKASLARETWSRQTSTLNSRFSLERVAERTAASLGWRQGPRDRCTNPRYFRPTTRDRHHARASVRSVLCAQRRDTWSWYTSVLRLHHSLLSYRLTGRGARSGHRKTPTMLQQRLDLHCSDAPSCRCPHGIRWLE